MILDQEKWMDFRRFKPLHEAGAVTYADIAQECEVDWRTVKRHLADDAPVSPPEGSPRTGTQPRKVTPEFENLIRGCWSRTSR